jgi:hypothetical protein
MTHPILNPFLLGAGEILMVNVGSTSTGGNVRAVKADLAKIELTVPVCTQVRKKGRSGGHSRGMVRGGNGGSGGGERGEAGGSGVVGVTDAHTHAHTHTCTPPPLTHTHRWARRSRCRDAWTNIGV